MKKTPTLNPLALWLDTKTARLLCASIFLVTLLCVSAAPALADEPLPLIWDCWIGDETSIGISCIHDGSFPRIYKSKFPMGGKMKSGNLLKHLLLVCVCLFALTAQATVLSDAERAYDAGTFAKAAKIFRFLAEQGDALAQYNLGKMYYRGHGVPQDAKEAAKWLQLAAEQGEAKAQFQLGIMYYKGHGVPQNSTEEAKWYRLAAEQGHALAQYDLGFMCAHGQGVPQDYQEAAKWYRLAAEQGDTYAQYNLGMMYHKGRGVPQDNVLAHMWISLAATNAAYSAFQSRYAGTRDKLVAKAMTANQIAKAQKLASKCTANKFKGC